jgi:hypothetical protein
VREVECSEVSEVKIGGLGNVSLFLLLYLLYYLSVSCSSVIYCHAFYCVFVLFVCNMCYLSVVLLYYCLRVKAELQFNNIYVSCEVRSGLLYLRRRHSS